VTEEPAEQSELQPFPEAATPARSMRGAAEDLSTLFGDEADERDLAHTALGPRRSTPVAETGARTGSALEGVTHRVTALGTELADAVARIQSVDRHLASTYQTLQSVLQRLPEEGSATGPAASVDFGPLTERLEVVRREVTRAGQVVAEHVERLGERLSTLEAEVRAMPAPVAGPAMSASAEPDRLAGLEVALTATAERLSVLEDRVGATLAHAESSRQSLEGLERGLAEMVSGLTGPPPRPEQDRVEPAPTDDIDALLASGLEEPAVESEPAEVEPDPADLEAQEALYWSHVADDSAPAEPEEQSETVEPASTAEPVEAAPPVEPLEAAEATPPEPAEPALSDLQPGLLEPIPEPAPAPSDAGASGNGRAPGSEPEVEPDRPDPAPLWPVPDDPSA
jgi:hypothetical protein